MSGADVQASLDGVRQRTATVIGAPKVLLNLTVHLLLTAPCAGVGMSLVHSVRLAVTTVIQDRRAGTCPNNAPA